MALDNQIRYATIDELYLDPLNPRLGRSNKGPDVSQEKVLELMRDWTLDELAISFLESGFWVQEALIVVNEPLYGRESLTVIEGNRRLAALKYLKLAIEGQPISRKWADLAAIKAPPENLFEQIPYIKADSRSDVEAFLGFRHVTGIKEWNPAEKAEYITKLIEERGMTYEEVMRKIGSKTATVRENYISYRVLIQMEEEEDISLSRVEEKFSVLYLSLKTEGAQRYLQIDMRTSPEAAQRPVPEDKLDELAKFALWLFGDDQRPPLVPESRYVHEFGVILNSPEALEYLERSERPIFETAYRIAGGDEPELIKLIDSASDNIEEALSTAHHYKQSKELQDSVERLGIDTFQLLRIFPSIREELMEDEC
jgi:ParB-like chromosome segregation protein Spo0J